ncbi:SUMF1/EgtB/PvdO family nonheme iron enzyme [Nannocystis punicea]|uniref:SUMF1/EgtB/PvdO family nonheme iron enzyme n=1 Tax=Nannocystis punicea TaxID=2995304 RepID=A0ABY7H2W7_9BACT|nr:SUMF1/EgtB/PvdO family nonheme iron enzyme [Nannocystis poenicansa]WAS93613.1 SUMF1/EgtB/PvdO family nonheme iron enzyme [Nannocystis poenicansa]
MLHVAAAPELYDHTLWSSATDERREELAQLVAAELGPEFFKYEGLRRYGQASAPVAVFAHALVGEMSLVPGGGFDMGLSPEEEAAIRTAREQAAAADDDFDQEFDLLLSELGQMRPLHRVVVPPFLIAQRVLSIGRALRWLPNLRDPLYGHVPGAAAHLNPEQITAVLVGTRLRLPAEAELEYAARGGLHRRLLPWGDVLPDDATIEAMLADEDGATHNAFGLHGYGLYPELCADHWHEHYRGAPDDGAPWLGSGMHVVRGGAADCYPWQGCGEWNLMLCAMRMNDRAAEFGASVRLVHGLGEHESEDVEMAEETGARRGGEKAGGKKASKAAAGKSSAKKASESSAAGKKSGGEKASKAAAGKKSGGKKASKAAAAGKKSGGEKASKTAAAKTSGKKASKSAVKESGGKKASESSAAGEKSGGKKASESSAATKKASGKKASEWAATKKSGGKKASKTAAGKKSGGEKASKSAAGKKSGGEKASKSSAAKKASKSVARLKKPAV